MRLLEHVRLLERIWYFGSYFSMDKTRAESFLNGVYARALKFHVIRMPCEKIVDLYIFLSVNITLC